MQASLHLWLVIRMFCLSSKGWAIKGDINQLFCIRNLSFAFKVHLNVLVKIIVNLLQLNWIFISAVKL